MSETTFDSFKEAVKETAFDKEMHRKLSWNIGKYADTVVKGKLQYEDLESAKMRAKNLKWKENACAPWCRKFQ